MNKKTIILGAAGVAVVALLAGYFFVLPAMQVGAYKNTVATKHSELNDTLNKLTAVLESDTFVKTEVEPSKIRSDVQAGNNAAKDVEAKLAQVKGDLTTFATWPLLDFNDKYKTALSIKADEQQYVAKTEAFVSEMKSVLAYMDKNADLTEKVTDFATSMDSAGQAESADDYAAQINSAAAKLQTTVDELAKLTPPASLKEGHDYSVKAIGEYIALFKEVAAAVKAGNEAKLMDLEKKITAKNDEITKKTDDYNAKFIRESDLRKLDDALNQLDRDIDRKQATL